MSGRHILRALWFRDRIRPSKSRVSKRALALGPELSGLRARRHRRIIVGVVESGVLAGMPSRESGARGDRCVVIVPVDPAHLHRRAYSRHSELDVILLGRVGLDVVLHLVLTRRLLKRQRDNVMDDDIRAP